MAELSPMMQQYLEIKKQHKDEILFYRIGDFYEMFFEDALTASKELDLTLTGKQCGLEERAPMCGVPFHSYEGYVARLIAKGYKVAICEQVEDPAKAKGWSSATSSAWSPPARSSRAACCRMTATITLPASISRQKSGSVLCGRLHRHGPHHRAGGGQDRPGGDHRAVPLPPQRSADEPRPAGLPRSDGLHQKEYDLLGGAGGG